MIVGRQGALAELRALVTDRVPTLVVGEAGIGKTTLLREAVAMFDCRSCWGGGLRTLSWMRYMPLTRAVQSSLPADATSAAAFVQANVGEALLVIDDLQWCDAPSLDVMELLAHSVPLLTAVREDDAGGRRVLELARSMGWEMVRLDPLAHEAAEILVRRLRPNLTRGEVSALVRRGAGNPLMLEHLLRSAAPAEGDLDSLLTARLRELPPQCRRAMAVLGLLGRPAPTQLLGGTAHLLLGRRLIVEDLTGTFRARHDLLAEAAVETLSVDERQALHQWLAESLDRPGEAADHYLAAGDASSAFDAAAMALSEATTPSERAHALRVQATTSPAPGCARILLDAVAAFIDAGDHQGALDLLASADVQGMDRARALLLEARAACFLGDSETARSRVDEGILIAGGTGSSTELALRIVDARLLVRSEWRPKEGVCAARHALRLATAIGQDEPAAHSVLGSALLIEGSPRWSDELMAALLAARRFDEHETECVAADSLVFGEFLAGDPARIDGLCDSMEKRTSNLGMRTWELQFRKNRVVLGFHAGADYREVVRHCRMLLGEPVAARPRQQLEATLALALAITGDDPAACQMLDDKLCAPRCDDTERALLLWSAAEVDWLAGRLERAVERADRCLGLAVGGFPAVTLGALTRQWALHELGLAQDRPIDPSTFPSLAAAGIESRALVLATDDPDGAAERPFIEAAERWRPFQRYAALRCLWAAGDAAGRAGATKRATKHLHAVEAEATSLGCEQLLRRVRRSMRPLRIQTRVRSTNAGSTQNDVLALVARGLTSGQIARQLAISTSTVDGHVRTAMRMLGARTRLEAALLAIAEKAPPTAHQRRPVVVVTVDRRTFTVAVDQRRPSSSRVHDGWSLPAEPWKLPEPNFVCAGEIRNANDAAGALHAAVRGADLVVYLPARLGAAVRESFLEGLGRITAIETAPLRQHLQNLTAEEQLLLDRLAAGHSVAASAAEAFISRRTAMRRLACAREKLGVRSNSEAIVAARRLP